MSLINDMLRDLDARGARPPLAITRVTDAPSRRSRRIWAIAVTAITIVAAITALLVNDTLHTASSTPHPQAAAAPATNEHAMPVTATTATQPPASPSAPQEATAAAIAPALTQPSPSLPAPSPSTPSTASTTSPETIRPATAPRPPAPPAATAPQRLSITSRTAGEREPDIARRLQAVADAMATGNVTQAEQGLLDVLARKPTHASARQSLAMLYLRQNQPESAIAVWQTGLRLEPRQTQWAQSLARLHLQRNEASAAAAVLALAAPSLASDTAYHALLGYAWQQANQASKASAVYRALVDFDPSQGTWWLGLALAEEARGEPAQALHAFTQARHRTGLENDVLRYIDQRISALQANPITASPP